MSQPNSSSSSSDSLHAFTDPPLCIVCEQVAQGLGPFSRYHLCQQHLDIDVQQANDKHQSVKEKLLAYSEGDTAGWFAKEKNDVERQLHEIETRFAELQQRLNEYWVGVREQFTARIDALQKCVRDLDDVKSYDREVKEALSSGNMAEVVDLAVAMEASLPDLAEDFSVCERVGSEFDVGGVVRRLEKLDQMVQRFVCGADATDAGVTARPKTRKAGVTARPETRDAGVTANDTEIDKSGPISMSHEIQLYSNVYWVGVCSDTSEFVSDRSGRVVPKESASDGSVALPQPCLVVKLNQKDHLTVMSLDGAVRLRTHCNDIKLDDCIYGLHCDRQLVFVALSAAVTVINLSGHMIGQIRPDTAGLGSISGIGGNAASVFVSSGNKIAAFSKATGQLETVITLSQLPHPQLCNLAIHQNSVFVTDMKHNHVHRVSIDTQQLVASHPTQRAEFQQFNYSLGVAIDSRGRVFVSEYLGHSVRAVAADDGSLLWTLGVPGESGSGGDRLDMPCGLAVVTGGPCEQLVVADFGNQRLLVLNLH